jgi:hypothetical protein
MGMKITLELPNALVRKFKSSVPNGRRSGMVVELLAKRLANVDASLERAAKKANTFRHLNSDMKHWEALN